MMRNIISGLLFLTSLSFSAVLTADRYEVYLKKGYSEIYKNGELVESDKLSTSLAMIYDRRNDRNYVVKDIGENINFVIDNDCTVIEGSDFYKKGSTVCPIDPKKAKIIVWVPISDNEVIPVTLERGFDNEDINKDGEKDDIVYEGFTNFGPVDITYTKLYDGKSGKLEYEELDIFNDATNMEGYVYLTYDVKIKTHKPKPAPKPLPEQEKIPTVSDILKAF